MGGTRVYYNDTALSQKFCSARDKTALAPVFTLIPSSGSSGLGYANPAFSRIYYKASFRLRKTFRANTLNHLVSVQATQRFRPPFELTAEVGAFWTVK